MGSMYRLCLLFLVLSGAAALTYQVAWVRLLGLSMGSTSASVATVLAAFFLGMAIGSYFAGKLTEKRSPSLAPYVAIEVLIGLSGLAMLPALLNLDRFVTLFPGLGHLLPFKFAVALAVLLIPCMAIGATFPVMAAVLVRRSGEIGVHLGRMYSLNTVGGVLGAAGAGFVVVPWVGLNGAVYLAVTLNFIIALLGGWIVWQSRGERQKVTPVVLTEAPLEEAVAPAPVPIPVARFALALMFVTGFTSIAAEVGYTKYLSIYFGTTLYGFAAILSIFLVGIAIGSWAVQRHIDGIRDPGRMIAIMVLVLCATLVLTRTGLGLLPQVSAWTGEISSGLLTWLIKHGMVLLVLLPPTLLFGALFPINLRLYCGDVVGLRKNAGKGYAVNTVGGILGSVTAGFFLIPRFGTDLLLLVVVVVMTLLAIPAAWVAAPSRLRLVAPAGVVVIGLSLVLLPGLNYRALLSTTSLMGQSKPEFAYLKEGKTAVISLTRTVNPFTLANTLTLANNGLPEAVMFANNPSFGGKSGALLGAFPYLLHPDPKSAFVVGLGGGIVTYALATTNLETVRVVELEPAVVEAVRFAHGGLVPALENPKVRLDVNDARNTMLMEEDTYDLIVSQPSHPWVAGMASVFSREFYDLAASRLNSGGLIIQWVNLFHTNKAVLGSIMQAFYQVFPHGMVFSSATMDQGVVWLIGSPDPIRYDPETVRRKLAALDPKMSPVARAVSAPNDLFSLYLLSREEALLFADGIQANTDLNLFTEVGLRSIERNPANTNDLFDQMSAVARLDVEPYLEGDVSQALYRYGTFLIKKGYMTLVDRVEAKLAQRDVLLARELRYMALLSEYRYPQATLLYDAHSSWSDKIHLEQAVTMAERTRFGTARLAVERIADADLRRVGTARLLFIQRRFEELAGVVPQTDRERVWQLMGVARHRPQEAVPGLRQIAISHRDLLGFPQLQVMAIYQLQHPELFSDLINPTLMLKNRTHIQGNKMRLLVEQALAKDDLSRARFILKKLEQIASPTSEDLMELRRKVEDAASEKPAPASG